MHLDQCVLVARVVLRPAGKTREIVVAEDHHVDASRGGDLLGVGHAFERFNHDGHEHVVVDRRPVVDAGPHLTEGAASGTAPADRRIARKARRVTRFQGIVHGGHNDADRTDVRRLLDRRFERIRRADHRCRADGRTGDHHSPDLVPGHGAVLHLEPDEVEVLADLAVEIGVEARNRVAGDLLVLEQQFLGLVVERPWRARVHRRLDLPAPAAPVRLGRRQRSANRLARRGARRATTALTASAGSRRPGSLLRLHGQCSDDQTGGKCETRDAHCATPFQRGHHRTATSGARATLPRHGASTRWRIRSSR